MEVKRRLAAALNAFLEPIRQRRARYSPAEVDDIVLEGSARARTIAEETMALTREAMRMNYFRPAQG